MTEFTFTDAQWDAVGAHLDKIGRGRSPGDRKSLELQCHLFVRLRPRLGKGLATPKKAAEAWERIGASARRLKAAIADLKEAGGADLTLIETSPGAQHEWLAGLDGLIRGADQAATLETINPPKTSKNADPLRDEMIIRLTRIWRGCGGGRSSAEDGALVAFLAAVLEPAFAAVNEATPSASSIRHVVRRASLAGEFF